MDQKQSLERLKVSDFLPVLSCRSLRKRREQSRKSSPRREAKSFQQSLYTHKQKDRNFFFFLLQNIKKIKALLVLKQNTKRVCVTVAKDVKSDDGIARLSDFNESPSE